MVRGRDSVKTRRGHDGTRVRRRGRGRDEGLSIPKIIGMFIASVTVSAITTKLTSYLGSVIIVGISSVLLAVFNALYERFFKASRKAAAKAILRMPHNDAIPGPMADRLHAIAAEDEETEPDGEAAETADRQEDGPGPAKATGGGHEDADGHSGRAGDGGRDRHGFFGSMSMTMKTVIAVLLFALATSLISWGVASVVEKPDVTNVTVKESKVEKLSQAEKDAIKSAAAAEVSSRIRQAQESADTANGNASDLDRRMDALEKRMDGITATLDGLEKKSGSSPSSSDITSLERQLTQMRQELDTLKTRQQQQRQPDSPPSDGSQPETGGIMGSDNGNR